MAAIEKEFLTLRVPVSFKYAVEMTAARERTTMSKMVISSLVREWPELQEALDEYEIEKAANTRYPTGGGNPNTTPEDSSF